MARRSVLASALIAIASPAAFGDEGTSSVRLLPPLPVQQVANQEVYANPFCEPKFRPIRNNNIQLASGGDQNPSVRLKALGKAVDLKPIGSRMPTAIRPEGLKIEAIAESSVRMNPLIESEHRANPDLINAGVTPMANERLEELELTRRGQTLAPAVRVAPPAAPVAKPAPLKAAPLITPTQVTPQVAAVSPATVKSHAAVTPELINDLNVMADALAPPVEVAQSLPVPMPPAEPKQVVDAAPEEEPSAPVFFTISDASEDIAAASSPSDVVVESEATGSEDANEVSGAEDANEPKTDSLVQSAEPIGLQPLSSDMDAESLTDSLRQIEPSTNGGIVRSAPEPRKLKGSGTSILNGKRFRPPVAVGAPPVAIQKQGSQVSTVKPALQNPIVAALPRHTTAKPQHNRPTKLHLTRAQVKSLTIGGHVRRISVTNKNVCQAVATGPNQLKLIGTGYGITRLVVWADTSSRSPTRIRTFEIHVEDAVEASGASVGNKTITLNSSIERTFPNAVINVQQFPDRLIVAGYCDTEDEAKKIIRMVRKTCIVPVRDEVKVR